MAIDTTQLLSIPYSKIKQAIVDLIQEKNCAPILVRLAWHDAGTYDVASNTGGPRASMRFKPVSQHDANNGLEIARNLLEPIKTKFPSISYADLWSLAGITAIHVTSKGKLSIPWRAGRVDCPEGYDTPDGRLPDATLSQGHLRSIFYRMGLNDTDIVALSGAHTLGRFHPERSRFEGPWTQDPFSFDNAYFVDLLNRQWVKEMNAQGIEQFYDKERGTAMAPSDLCLLTDETFRELVERYASDESEFFKDFAKSFQKLLELGYKDDELTLINFSY